MSTPAHPAETNVPFEGLSDDERMILMCRTANVVKELVGRLYPADPLRLREAFWGSDEDADISMDIPEACKNTPRKSAQQRILKTVLASHANGKNIMN